MNKDFDIEAFMSLENYASDERKKRRKGAGGTQEFFTPYELVKKMAEHIDEKSWADPEKTFLEPCFGNGQFVIYIIFKRLAAGLNWRDVMSTLYGVELMEDNVNKTKNRIIELFDGLGIEYEKEELLEIMNNNLVCHDFFTWDFENWKEMEEIDKKKK